MKQARIISLVVLLMGAIVALIVDRCTSGGERYVVRTRVETVTAQPKPIVITSGPQTVRTMRVHDTIEVSDDAAVTRMALEIDSLQRLIAQHSVRRTFRLDTITSDGDTVYVLCDETNRRIETEIRHKPIMATRVITDTVLDLSPRRTFIELHPYFAMSAHVPLTTVWQYQANVGVRMEIGRMIAPFADLQIMTTQVPQVRLGFELQY